MKIPTHLELVRGPAHVYLSMPSPADRKNELIVARVDPFNDLPDGAEEAFLTLFAHAPALVCGLLDLYARAQACQSRTDKAQLLNDFLIGQREMIDDIQESFDLVEDG